MQWIIKLDDGLARLSYLCGWVACVAMLLMAGNVFYDVVADFALDSYSMGEGSGDPGGLPHRWLIKSVIPVTAFFIAIAGLNMATFALRVMSGEKQYEGENSGGGLA